MRYYEVRRKTKIIFLPIVVVAFIALFATTLQAQRAPGPDSAPPNPLGMSDRDRSILDREMQLNAMERDRRRAIKRDPQLAFAQIREDFRRMQVTNLEMMRTITSGNPLDYKLISEAAADIKKRAARLKINLVFPEAEKDDGRQKSQDPEISGLKSSLMALDDLILSFVTNPIFKEAGVVNAKLGGKARRDLDDIIELSDKVKKSAEKMSKNAGK